MLNALGRLSLTTSISSMDIYVPLFFVGIVRMIRKYRAFVGGSIAISYTRPSDSELL